MYHRTCCRRLQNIPGEEVKKGANFHMSPGGNASEIVFILLVYKNEADPRELRSSPPVRDDDVHTNR